MANRQEVLHQALQLEADERQRLVHELALSLEPQPCGDAATAEEAWREEISRRALAVEQGGGEFVDAREVIRQARAEVLARLKTK